MKISCACDTAIFGGRKRIDADVDAIKACRCKRDGHLLKQDAVGCEAKLFNLGNSADTAADIDDSAAHQRFAAGDADLIDPEPGYGVNDPLDLFHTQDLTVLFFDDAFLGHAVQAAQIAQIGD